MDIGILRAHKCKACLILGGAAAACIGTPFLVSSSTQEPDKPQQPENLPEPVKPQIKPVAHENDPQPKGESHSARLASLKQKKGVLKTNVENRDTLYRNSLNKATSLSKLDREFNQCKSKNEVNIGITEEEKNGLKSSYEAVKDDRKAYEELKKEIEGELTANESAADKHPEDETKYQNFQKKYEEVNGKYENLEKKGSNQKLMDSYRTVYQKLTKANASCSLKDVIKINDWLGEINNSIK